MFVKTIYTNYFNDSFKAIAFIVQGMQVARGSFESHVYMTTTAVRQLRKCVITRQTDGQTMIPVSTGKIIRIKRQCWTQTDKSQSRVIRCLKYQSRR